MCCLLPAVGAVSLGTAVVSAIQAADTGFQLLSLSLSLSVLSGLELLLPIHDSSIVYGTRQTNMQPVTYICTCYLLLALLITTN